MNKNFLSIHIIPAIIVIILFGSVESNAYSLTDQEQRNLIGFAIGCKDGLAGKEPDKTQYDKVDGFSTHSVAYNVGYIDGFNSCSKNFQIDDVIEPN